VNRRDVVLAGALSHTDRRRRDEHRRQTILAAITARDRLMISL